jgi:effector-binding domain-containing protein
MLRHYEKCGLFSPARTDAETGYRLYAAGQVSFVGRITALRDLGFSIQQIGEILPRFEDKAYLDKVLHERAAEVRLDIEAGRYRLKKLMEMSGELRKERDIMLYEVELKKLDAVKVLSLRGILPHYNEESMLWEKLSTYIAENGIACHSDGYSVYYDDAYMEANPDVEVAIPVDELGESRGEFVYKEYPAIELAAALRFSGPFDGGYDAAGEKLARWMEENGYAFAGNLRGHVLISPDEQPDPERWLTQLEVPVKKI